MRTVRFVTAAAQVIDVDPDVILTRVTGGEVVAGEAAPAYVVLIPQGHRPAIRAMRDGGCWKRNLLRLRAGDPERLVLGRHCSAKGMQEAPRTFTALPPKAEAPAPKARDLATEWAVRAQAAVKTALWEVVHTGEHCAVRVVETEFTLALDLTASRDDKRARDTLKLVAASVTAMVDGVDVRGTIYSCQTQEQRAEAVELAVNLLSRRGHTVWRKAAPVEGE
jgi:hypothetical protein